jgi:hypothetical protein
MIDYFSLNTDFFTYRLKGIKWSEIPQICDDMIDLFGLEAYRKRIIEKLRYVFYKEIFLLVG